MCLNLSLAEAREWKRRGSAIFEDANASAAKMDIDPLLISAPDLSRLVSAIDSVKKRHGLLIEDALVAAINKVPGWHAERQTAVSHGGENFKLDCFAYNASTETLYIFECKRGHSKGDSGALRSIGARLRKVKVASEKRASDIGLKVSKTEVFILSFYGKRWISSFPIFDRTEISNIFPACAVRFADEFTRYTENQAAIHYGSRLKVEPDATDLRGTIFDRLDEFDLPPPTIIGTVGIFVCEVWWTPTRVAAPQGGVADCRGGNPRGQYLPSCQAAALVKRSAYRMANWFCQAATSSITASVTELTKSALTSVP